MDRRKVVMSRPLAYPKRHVPTFKPQQDILFGIAITCVNLIASKNGAQYTETKTRCLAPKVYAEGDRMRGGVSRGKFLICLIWELCILVDSRVL
jgi:hypothetical protein